MKNVKIIENNKWLIQRIIIMNCAFILLLQSHVVAGLWGTTHKWGQSRWGIYSTEEYDVGSVINPPPSIETSIPPFVKPESNQNAFQWNDLTNELKVINISSGGSVITWKSQTDNIDISKWITTQWPNIVFYDVYMKKGNTAYIGYEKEVTWKKLEYYNPGYTDKYRIKIKLIEEGGLNREFDIAEIEKSINENQYTTSYTFKDTEIGDWKIRIEVSDSPDYYGISDVIYIRDVDSYDGIIGEVIEPPEGADPNQAPTWDEKYNDAIYYDSQRKKLYATGRPDEEITIIWKGETNQDIPSKVINKWPDDPIIHIAESLPVNLNHSKYQFVQIKYRSESSNAKIDGSNQYTCTSGRNVLHFAEEDFQTSEPVFKAIETVSYNQELEYSSCIIGQRINYKDHESPDGENGYIVNRIAPYALNTEESEPYNGHIQEQRKGPIIAVNLDYNESPDNDLIVIWYKKDEATSTYWPSIPIRYRPEWPTDPKKIIIASMSGSGVLTTDKYQNMRVYEQSGKDNPGYNPNEEHALIINGILYAQRDDLNIKTGENYCLENDKVSEAYSLLMYQNQTLNYQWFFEVYKVIREENPYFFRYKVKAGRKLEPPMPLSFKQYCEESFIAIDENSDLVTWKDNKQNIWVKAGDKNNEGPVEISARYYERWGDECKPWLDDGSGLPITIVYEVYWPDDEIWPDADPLPEMSIGDTLLKPKNGLPDISSQCSVNILFDQVEELTNGEGHSVNLVSIMEMREVTLTSLPTEIKVLQQNGKEIFLDLPYHLRRRISYDNITNKLQIKGIFDNSGLGEPLILLNILHDYETTLLKGLSSNIDYRNAVDQLSVLTKSKASENAKLIKGSDNIKALSTGSAKGMQYASYVTLVFNSVEECDDPISMEILKVVPKLYTGEIKVIKPDNVFDEKITLRHNAHFNANTEGIEFEWRYKEPNEGLAPSYDKNGTNNTWIKYEPDASQSEYGGTLDITIEGSGINSLKNYYYIVRYKGFDGVGEETWSEWTEPALCEGWIKRVTGGIGPYNQRFNDYHNSEINTTSSMIIQAGKRFEGPVALNSSAANVNNLGLIELYETVLRRGKALSIDGAPAVNDKEVNKELLLAAGKIADLYMLLGNEAYADAADPTIGFDTNNGQVGSEASSIFSFQNQLSSLLEEEIALLRGRKEKGYNPVYNRLIWNYSKDSGEVAYNSNYNIDDVDENGVIDEEDAKTMFPQGHGDAWGHYLTAIKAYYNLIIHQKYTWIPIKETINIAGKPVEVDYYDERKFAKSAAARAKTGSEIVNLTYLKKYSENSPNQGTGYKDPEHAWGVSCWAIRSAQGAYFDWIVANKLIPSEDKVHTGIAQIDRTTVLEIRDISSHVTDIQSTMDKSDTGLNPLGLAHGVVPFDINPDKLDEGITHFEQIHDRAVRVLNNAIVLFNHANENSERIRNQQDTLSHFKQNVNNQICDYNNRLIEIFGEPYPDDVGSGGNYPEGYKGPDIYHYSYVDPSELTGVESSSTQVFTVKINNYLSVNDDGSINRETKDVNFHISTHGLGMIRPSHWKGKRTVPGEIQIARSDLIQAKARFERSLIEYNHLIGQIESTSKKIEEKINLNAQVIQIKNSMNNTQISLNDQIKNTRALQLKFRTTARKATIYANAVAEALPSIAGIFIGPTPGTITDPTAPLRSAIQLSGALKNFQDNLAADMVSLEELDHQQAKEITGSLSSIKIDRLINNFEVNQQISQLEQFIRNEAVKRLEIYTIKENMEQTKSRYLAMLSKGLRLYDELIRFKKQTASEIQDYRYKDMAFRIFRNDALQKYRAQFDLAARYVYLTAKAYDYETNMLSEDTQAGVNFLNNIVKQRLIGSVINGQPITGVGLTDPMARMKANFDVLKPELGINNPQKETNQFSLRKELFRIKIGNSSNKKWQEILEKHIISNLWDLPEFKRYCRPYTSEDYNEQPGIVIPFGSNITSQMNFFGWPLIGGDSYYSATNFTTKIRSVGVWFSNYNNLCMSETPRVYLIPVGIDIMRSPTGNTLAIREWQVLDQKIPVPFPISQFPDDKNWVPIFDTLSGTFNEISRYSDFRVYHDNGLNISELINDSRLIGRSVWNTRWLLIIPGANLSGHDPNGALDTFIYGPKLSGSDERNGDGVSDIKIFFDTYAYSGN